MKKIIIAGILATAATIIATTQAATPVITFATTQPTYDGTSARMLSIGTSSPYTVSTVINDPTDPLATDGIYLNITNDPTSFTFTSDKTSVVATDGCKCEKVSGTTYRLTIKATGTGYAKVGVKASNGSSSTVFTFNVGASAESGNGANTVFPTTIADASAAAAVDENYMLICDDETNMLRLFSRTHSGASLATFDITKDAGGINGEEFDLEGASVSKSYNAGRRVYWIGSLGNSKKGKDKPYRNRVIATDITGTAPNISVDVYSYYDKMREALVSWGDGCNWNFSKSIDGLIPKRIDGFNIEGLSVTPEGESAYIGFRAPCVPLKGVAASSSNRKYAVAALVTNFETMMNTAGKTETTPVIGEPVLFDFGGLGIRSMEMVGDAGYFIIAGLFEGGGQPSVYFWNGVKTDPTKEAITEGPNLVKINIDMSDLVQASSDGVVEGHPEALLAEQNGKQITGHIICDNGTVDYYGDGQEAKALDEPYKKFRQDTFVFQLPDDYVPSSEVATKIEDAKAESLKSGDIYNINGQKVDDSYKGVIIKGGKVYLKVR